MQVISGIYFGISNGVTHGGALSTILFCIYMDNLLLSLKNNGVGCHVGSEFCGAFGYVDDNYIIESEC